MTLDYSFGAVPQIWFSGGLPYDGMKTEKVQVTLPGTSDGPFPPTFKIGDLLCYHRPSPDEWAVVLLLQYHAGTNPPMPTAPPLGAWHPAPGAPIIGQIRIPLPPDAVRQIKRNPGEGYDYELTLRDVRLRNVTGE